MSGGTFSLTQANDADVRTNGISTITAQEEKELKRVFDYMCNFSIKCKIYAEISDLESWQKAAKAKFNANATPGVNADTKRFDTNFAATQLQIDVLRKKIDDLDDKPDENRSHRKISCTDVMEMFKNLNQKCVKVDVEEMIWEVDEDLDGCVNWSEFKLMFGRNIKDKAGLEPSRLFHLAQFLIYDHNQNGLVSVDETMHMLYARYGRSAPKMESKLKELFGVDMHEFGREGGEIPFSKYLGAVEKVQLESFFRTTRGQNILAKSATIVGSSTMAETMKKMKKLTENEDND